MRSACSCSAAVLLLVVAGCGGHARADPYAYDRSRPLAVTDAGVALSGPKMTVHVLSYAAVGRVRAFLVLPRTSGRHAAVLLLHGSGGTREDLLLVAAELAARDIVAMTISQPNDAQDYRPLVVNARRALDVLAARRDVDAGRLGLVGFSLGAQTAAILAGDDRRLRAVGLISGRGNAVPDRWIRKTHAHLFFQSGTHDEVVPHAQLVELVDAAPGHPRVRWYDAGHGMTRRAFDDQVAWQAEELG
jgi:dienelactone hydrolase